METTSLLVVDSTLSFLNLLLFFFACFIFIKLYRLIKLSDKAMFLSIFTITLSILFNFIYWLLSVLQLITDSGYLHTNEGDAFKFFFAIVGVMLNIFAFVLDLYKWSNFIIATGEKFTYKDNEQE